jgi:hypothetical protein
MNSRIFSLLLLVKNNINSIRINPVYKAHVRH